jgi:hypothetical protein
MSIAMMIMRKRHRMTTWASTIIVGVGQVGKEHRDELEAAGDLK